MWGAVISGVTSLASSYMDNRKVKTEHKAKVEQARVNAEINRIEKAAQSDQDYDLEALRQTRYSWKDEYVLVIITLPFICLLYTSPSPRDGLLSRMPSSA